MVEARTVAVMLVASVACAPSGRFEPDVAFEVRDFRWERDTATEYSFRWTGQGTLVARGADADSLYFVAVEVIRTQFADPLEPADSFVSGYVVRGGTAQVELGDYVARCDRYQTRNCVTEGRTPEARFRVLGWQLLTGAP